MERELSYLYKKNLLIKNLKLLGCNLLRDDSDIDFGLIDKEREEEVYNYLINEDFICTSRDSQKINFKKFVEGKILDVDVEINTKYLKQYFYNIEIKKNFEEEYFKYPDKNQIAMKTVRYMMLLRGKEIKYRKFLLENRKKIEENNFFLDKLTVNPFKKEIDFDRFISILKVNKIDIIKYIKFKYLLYFIYFKLKSFLIKRKGIVIAIDGVDGSGKTTIIDILTKELDKPSLYMGERGYRYENFYSKKKHFLLKPFSLIGQYIEKIYRVFKARKLAIKFGVVVSDRYHHYSKTATDKKWLDLFNKFFFYFYPKPDKYIVFWNESDIILSRKKEVTREYIEELNKNKEIIYQGATFIKNDNIDDTLNLILKEIYEN
jgi:thymidylate kinase